MHAQNVSLFLSSEVVSFSHLSNECDGDSVELKWSEMG